VIDDPKWFVGASLFIVAVSTVFCLILRKKETTVAPARAISKT